MMAVKKEILYDENRRPVKVLIDFAEWMKVEAALGSAEVEPNGHLLNEFAGKFDFGGDPMEIQRRMRSEWPA
jgi:hypothetical protein